MVGKVVSADQQARKQFMLLAEFRYLLITCRKVMLITFSKLLIRTQLFQEAVYLTA